MYNVQPYENKAMFIQICTVTVSMMDAERTVVMGYGGLGPIGCSIKQQAIADSDVLGRCCRTKGVFQEVIGNGKTGSSFLIGV